MDEKSISKLYGEIKNLVSLTDTSRKGFMKMLKLKDPLKVSLET
jgi:hypothetical protein